ncbi:hypothetical protein, partial [Streptomyces sp. NPDC050704]|uniref:hypothetical protein n=1 Tax=Streptomyces sp. NPDC050704 TaxID=3157219 RepID=UPI0034439E55
TFLPKANDNWSREAAPSAGARQGREELRAQPTTTRTSQPNPSPTFQGRGELRDQPTTTGT